MGCQSEVDIGDYLTFSVTTHDPDTGVLTDADSVPTYRIYEDETDTAILNGSMAKLDDSNTTGFYTERVACTAANGFEDGKSYTIYISATVDSDTGGICYGFRAQTAVWSEGTRTLTQSAASVTSAVSGSTLTCKRGDTFSATLSDLSLTGTTKVWFTVKKNANDADTASIIQIDDATGLLYVNGAVATAGDGSLTVNAGAGTLAISIEESVTDDLEVDDDLYYDVQTLISGAVTTATEGTFVVTSDITRAIV